MENKTKTIFVALIAVALVPLIVMGISDATSEDPTIPDKVPDRVIQIQKPVETQAEINNMKTFQNIHQERTTLTNSLDAIAEQHKNSAIPQDAQDKINKINKRLSELESEFAVIQAEAHKLYALSADDEKQLLDAQNIILDAGIPVTTLGSDSKAGALAIGFESQAIADTHIPRIEQLIDVPYYVNIHDALMFNTCLSQTDDCDPLMGGVRVTTQYNSTHTAKCTYAIPAVRIVDLWKTETGFVTAGHCFETQSRNDVWQPTNRHSKIGDLTKRVVGGICDCAFVKKAGTESTTLGMFSGNTTNIAITSKSDASRGDYVYLIGSVSGRIGAQVSAINVYINSGDGPIRGTTVLNANVSNGDSGGPVIDYTTQKKYHGLIMASENNSVYSIPWSNIKVGLNLK